MTIDQLHQQNYQMLQSHAQVCAELAALGKRQSSLQQRADLILEDIANLTAEINKRAEETKDQESTEKE